MKVAIAGGHFSPAYSIIEDKNRPFDIVVFGRKYALEGDKKTPSFEYEICKRENIPFHALSAGRLQRKITKHTIPSLAKSPVGLYEAYTALKKEKIDVVLLFGGYISIPLAIAAKLLSIPIVIHEQTQQAGLSNKTIAKFADAVCISFESSQKLFPKRKTVLTGNPLRKEVFSVEKSIPVPTGKILYVTGGSTGSHFINTLIESTLEVLLKDYVVIHQTGDSKEFDDFDRLTKLRDSLKEDVKKRYIIRKFIYPEEIGWILKHTEVIVARSGINTTLELIALQKKALLIPLPHGQVGEQLKNAQLIKKLSLGDYIEQKNATPEEFIQQLRDVENMKIGREKSPYYIPNATQNIIDTVQLVYEKKRQSKQVETP